MTNVNDNVRISDNIGVVASSSSKQLSSIRTLSLPFFILNILLLINSYSAWVDKQKLVKIIPNIFPLKTRIIASIIARLFVELLQKQNTKYIE
jgi:hypothetical protein